MIVAILGFKIMDMVNNYVKCIHSSFDQIWNWLSYVILWSDVRGEQIG